MINNLKKGYDCASILKDILERKQIIDNYHLTGYLDRDQAIKMIVELRQTDAEVATVTSARLVVSSTPFSSVSNQGIIAELQMQIDILSAKSMVEFTRRSLCAGWIKRNKKGVAVSGVCAKNGTGFSSNCKSFIDNRGRLPLGSKA